MTQDLDRLAKMDPSSDYSIPSNYDMAIQTIKDVADASDGVAAQYMQRLSVIQDQMTAAESTVRNLQLTFDQEAKPTVENQIISGKASKKEMKKLNYFFGIMAEETHMFHEQVQNG